LGRTAVIPQGFPPTFINQHLALLRLRQLNPTFVAAALSSASAKAKWLDLNRAAVKSGLNFDDIRSFPMIAPPLPLQEEFAQRVTKTRELETTQAVSRRRVDNLFESMLHRAFNGGL
jgi:type I restriction enzyme S subunit